MGMDKIIIRGAKEHNLKDLNIDLPRDKFIVITGLSGSGKSSLAFDTIYAEGQRRYVESLSAYARQFLEMMEKPNVEFIEGLSPAISIEQRNAGRNPRSTVATITEIYDYLRVLFARCGEPHCHICGKPIQSQTLDQIVDYVLQFPEKTRLQILGPAVRGRKGEYKKDIESLSKKGFVRVRIDKDIYEIEDIPKLDKNKKHDIEVVIDRLIMKDGIRERLSDSIETSLKLTDGLVLVMYKKPDDEDWQEKIFSEKLACIECGMSLLELHPRIFSFNAPYGACPVCHGLGDATEFAIDLIIPDPDKTINQGAIAPIADFESSGWYKSIFKGVAETYGFSLDKPFSELPKKIVDVILYGSGSKEISFTATSKSRNGQYKGRTRFEGIIPMLKRRFRETTSDGMKDYYQKFMRSKPCPECKGKRLRPESLAVLIDNKSIADITELSVKNALKFFKELHFDDNRTHISKQVLKEIVSRLKFLSDVGLDYITLNRKAGTLSGGESQRIRLATQIGSQLVGVLYVLDEPTIGLHQRDCQRLINTLLNLKNLGNTVIVVEHDEQTINQADHIVDLGPGAGIHGGEIVAQGTLEEILQSPASLTGQYISKKLSIPVPESIHTGNGKNILLKKVSKNNLKNINAVFPLGKLISITGVSGSGKSTLINDILFQAIRNKLNRKNSPVDGLNAIEGVSNIDKIISIDQSPIGRTPRSNPATYSGVFTPIRELFANLKESKMRGYKPGRFSFNLKGGRCESCEGAGQKKIEMHFLPDIYVTCEVCKGKRYNSETLDVKYKNKNIFEVLEMTIEEAITFFENQPSISNKLQTLFDVGLGYIKLGQSATTLSGGEAQRVKLASELSKRSTGRTLYLLDEPTTGLHFDDVRKLIEVLIRLVDQGNTVIVIEHNLDVIKNADYIIDLGPEGGDEGGQIVFAGQPEDLIEHPTSHTGKYLKTAYKEDGILDKPKRRTEGLELLSSK